jgi:hypothetical protein
VDGKIAYGVKFSPDGSTVALAACILPPEDKPYLEVLEYRSMSAGFSWLVTWLSSRWKEAVIIVVDGKSYAQSVTEALINGGVKDKVVRLAKPDDVIAAASMTLNGIREGVITHFDQPALNDVVAYARRRQINKVGGWGWGGDGDVSPLEAVSLALWGATNSKRDPTKKMKVAF